MGVLSTLGKIIGIGAAPFTGGASLPLVGIAGLAGDLLGKAGEQRAAGRQLEANAARDYDQQELQRYLAEIGRSNAQLGQERFLADEQQRNIGNAQRGNLLANVQDVKFNLSPRLAAHTPTVTGGVRPSAMPQRGEIGNAMYRNAITDMLDPAAARGRLPTLGAPPAATQTPSASGLDTFLNYASLGLSGANSIGQLLNRRPASSPAPTGATNLPSISGGVTFGGGSAPPASSGNPFNPNPYDFSRPGALPPAPQPQDPLTILQQRRALMPRTAFGVPTQPLPYYAGGQ